MCTQLWRHTHEPLYEHTRSHTNTSECSCRHPRSHSCEHHAHTCTCSCTRHPWYTCARTQPQAHSRPYSCTHTQGGTHHHVCTLVHTHTCAHTTTLEAHARARTRCKHRVVLMCAALPPAPPLPPTSLSCSAPSLCRLQPVCAGYTLGCVPGRSSYRESRASPWREIVPRGSPAALLLKGGKQKRPSYLSGRTPASGTTPRRPRDDLVGICVQQGRWALRAAAGRGCTDGVPAGRQARTPTLSGLPSRIPGARWESS